MTTYARIENRQAYLNTHFGQSLAALWLGLNLDMLEAIVGRYSKGKRKGQLRGQICWKKVVSGGWHRDDWNGHVEYPGTIMDIHLADAFTGRSL